MVSVILVHMVILLMYYEIKLSYRISQNIVLKNKLQNEKRKKEKNNNTT